MPPGSTPAPVQPARLFDRITALASAGAVLHVGAHPDDEESGLIAYLSRKYRVRTVYWSATRGEGGQNRRGPERAEALGIVRTWESLDARHVDGGEVLYGPFYDFGFSKSGEDTLRHWGRDAVVREIVRAIRTVQPMIVIGRWSGGAADGHGHHQAVGLVTGEAFEAAGDGDRYPELGLPPWQADKLYRSVAGDWQPGESGTFGTIVPEYDDAGHLRIDTGEIDAVAGLTYQEQAHAAVNQHRSQGMGFVPEPGSYFYYYRLDRTRCPSAEPDKGFFDDLDSTLAGLASNPGADSVVAQRLVAVGQAVHDAAEQFRPNRTQDCVPALFRGMNILSDVLDDLADPADLAENALSHYVSRRIVEFEEVIAACLHLRAECLVERARLTPGSDVTVVVRLWSGHAHQVDVQGVELHTPPGWTLKRTSEGGSAPHETRFHLTVSDTAEPHSPYWLREPRGPYRYEWPETARELGQALDDPLVWADVAVDVDGNALSLRSAAVHRSGFPGGSRLLPLTVVPPLALAPLQRRVILPLEPRTAVLDLDVTVRCIEPGTGASRLSLTVPEGWTVDPPHQEITLDNAGDAVTRHLRVAVPEHPRPGTYTLGYDLIVDGRPCALELNPVRLGVPGSSAPPDEDSAVAEAHMVRAAAVQVDLVDAVFVHTLRYGYIRGVDEQILTSLARFALDIDELTDDQLEYADLSAYDAIVVGPNAYGVRPAVWLNTARLLDFVAQGGTLIVQHQTYGYGAVGLTPHPLQYHQPHDRVTDPRAPVTVLDPDHAVLHQPNEIRATDFDGWIHDRGMYFMGEWDRRYTPVLACADLGEEPREGALLITAYGRGTYVYTGLSFYRQVPAGVPGAVRLFANLLGLADVRVRERMSRLGALDLFAFMTDAQLYEAARTVSERWVDANTYLAKEGERGHEMYLLVDGSIDVLKHVDGGDDVVLYQAGPGDVLGELTLLADVPRSASLRAITDAIVLVVREEALEEWLRRHPDLARGMMRRLATRIVTTGSGR